MPGIGVPIWNIWVRLDRQSPNIIGLTHSCDPTLQSQLFQIPLREYPGALHVDVQQPIIEHRAVMIPPGDVSVQYCSSLLSSSLVFI